VISTGMLFAGQLVQVPGVPILAPASHGGPPRCRLHPGDYRARAQPPFQRLIHSTKGLDRQHVKPGAGPPGRELAVADYWAQDPVHSAAHIVIGSDGTVACLGDLVRDEAFHATVSNPYSVGIELYQEADGGIWEATFVSLVRIAEVLCDALAIPFQVVADPYTGHPLPRFLNGGPTYRGILGHRNNTEQRGRGDPGDEAIARLVAAGAEPVLAGQGQDLELGRARQRWLVGQGERIAVDGLVGPASLAAARRRGYERWRDVPSAAA